MRRNAIKLLRAEGLLFLADENKCIKGVWHCFLKQTCARMCTSFHESVHLFREFHGKFNCKVHSHSLTGQNNLMLLEEQEVKQRVYVCKHTEPAESRTYFHALSL
jgi:hypothetical protein